jgi:AcrR family transcriptional regulator
MATESQQPSASPPDMALSQQTRQRLLEAAGEVFAEYGYRAATIRQICQRAGANIAAVNYHFRGKDKLYAECVSYWLNEALKKYPPDMGLPPDSTPQQRLHAFVRSFLYRILDQSRHAWYGKLVARNLIEHTPYLDSCVEQAIRPMAQRLHEIIRAIVGPKVGERDIRLAALSIVGQIVLHRHSRPVIARLYPDLTYTAQDLERLAEHITQFSLAGLDRLAARAQRDTQADQNSPGVS